MESLVEEATFPGLEGKSQQRVVRKIERMKARKRKDGLQFSAFKQIVAETELLKGWEMFEVKLFDVSINQIAVLQFESFDTCEI